jgi:hypothetical protein
MGCRLASHPKRDLALNDDKFLEGGKKNISYKNTTKLKTKSKSG